MSVPGVASLSLSYLFTNLTLRAEEKTEGTQDSAAAEDQKKKKGLWTKIKHKV